MTTLTTETLPFGLIDGLGMFTVFNSEEDAALVATKGNAKSEREGTGEEYAPVQRKDGKFLVVATIREDEVCYYIPAEMVAA